MGDKNKHTDPPGDRDGSRGNSHSGTTGDAGGRSLNPTDIEAIIGDVAKTTSERNPLLASAVMSPLHQVSHA